MANLATKPEYELPSTLVTQEEKFRDKAGILRRLMKLGIGRTTDFDFVLLEYDYGNLLLEYDCGVPKAVIEYEHKYAKPQNPTSLQQEFIKLGNNYEIPVLECRYSEDYSSYNVVPLNDYAKKFLPERKTFDERSWITLLYEMKGHKVTPEFLENMEVEK